VLWNNALVNATSLMTFEQVFADGQRWGRLVENAVGAHLLNDLHGAPWAVAYWRDGPAEVDYVVSHGARTWAVEVKSGRADRTSGATAFRKRYPRSRYWLVGDTGLPLADFFTRPARECFE
jgi:predicted AAA+ superfamily ATPase